MCLFVHKLICSTLVTSNRVYLKQNALFSKQVPLLIFLIWEWYYSLLFFKTLPQSKSWNYLRFLHFFEPYINISHQELTNSPSQYLLKLSFPFHCHYHHALGTSFTSRLPQSFYPGSTWKDDPKHFNRLVSRNWIQYFFSNLVLSYLQIYEYFALCSSLSQISSLYCLHCSIYLKCLYTLYLSH